MTTSIDDFDAIRTRRPSGELAGPVGCDDDPVLGLARQLEERIAAVRRSEEAVRRVEAEYPHDAVVAAESAALDYIDAIKEVGEETAQALFAIYLDRARCDQARWDLEEEILTTPATSAAGVLAQVTLLRKQAEDHEAPTAEMLDIVIGRLRTIAGIFDGPAPALAEEAQP